VGFGGRLASSPSQPRNATAPVSHGFLTRDGVPPGEIAAAAREQLRAYPHVQIVDDTVTLADTTFPLDDPFWVLATQNPVEQEGVYTLPEAQLDRFSMMLRVGYPSAGEEVEMLEVRMNQTTIERRVSPSDVHVLREFIHSTVYIDGKILEYIVRLGRATRDPGGVGRADLREMLQLGISPRSYQHLLALSRVTAFLHGRTWALPEDVKEIFCDAARHRIARTVRAQAENVDADAILEELLTAVPIP